MIPEGGPAWTGQVNEELTIKFNKEGIYGYKCTPHYILGMVGLIVVGDKSSNIDKSIKFAEEEQTKFATNKNRFTDYFSQIK
jgi:pseudoazurin